MVIFDFLSIAYLIPVLMIVIDKNKIYQICDYLGIDAIDVTSNTLILGVLILILIFVTKNSIQTRFNRNLFYFLYDLSNKVSVNVIKIFLRNDFLVYQKQNKGKVMNLVTKVSGDFCCRFLHAIIVLVSESFVLLIITSLLFFINPIITSVTFLLLVIFCIAIYLLKKSQLKLINDKFNILQSSCNAIVLNIIDGYLEIKSSNRQTIYSDQFSEVNKKLNRATALLVSNSYNYSKYLEIFLILILSVLAFSVANSLENNIALLSAFAALGFKLIPSLSKILNAFTHIKSYYYSIDTLNDVITKEVTETSLKKIDFTSQLKFNNVSFGYTSKDLIFESINLEIQKGDFCLISGSSGIGKTTLMYLIMGLVKPNNGAITIDGNNTVGTNVFSFISYVPQQPFLFNGTLLENITMGQAKQDIDFDFIHYLAEQLSLTSFIEQLADSYNTILLHDSLRFSGGQKQRLALLRALYTRPKLLLLDEITNQLNTELEISIIQFLKSFAKTQNCTVLSISHNPTIKGYFDKVFNIENKKLITITS